MEALQKLGIDFKVLIAQIVNFGILFLILKYLLYKPILNVLEKRRVRIKESLEKATVIEKKYAEAEESYNQKILRANKEADEILDNIKDSAEKVRKEIIEKAEKEASAIKMAAQRDLAEERHALYADVKRNSGKLAIFILTKILKQDLGEEFCQKSVDKALKEMEV